MNVKAMFKKLIGTNNKKLTEALVLKTQGTKYLDLFYKVLDGSLNQGGYEKVFNKYVKNFSSGKVYDFMYFENKSGKPFLFLGMTYPKYPKKIKGAHKEAEALKKSIDTVLKKALVFGKIKVSADANGTLEFLVNTTKLTAKVIKKANVVDTLNDYIEKGSLKASNGKPIKFVDASKGKGFSDAEYIKAEVEQWLTQAKKMQEKPPVGHSGRTMLLGALLDEAKDIVQNVETLKTLDAEAYALLNGKMSGGISELYLGAENEMRKRHSNFRKEKNQNNGKSIKSSLQKNWLDYLSDKTPSALDVAFVLDSKMPKILGYKTMIAKLDLSQKVEEWIEEVEGFLIEQDGLSPQQIKALNIAKAARAIRNAAKRMSELGQATVENIKDSIDDLAHFADEFAETMNSLKSQLSNEDLEAYQKAISEINSARSELFAFLTTALNKYIKAFDKKRVQVSSMKLFAKEFSRTYDLLVADTATNPDAFDKFDKAVDAFVKEYKDANATMSVMATTLNTFKIKVKALVDVLENMPAMFKASFSKVREINQKVTEMTKEQALIDELNSKYASGTISDEEVLIAKQKIEESKALISAFEDRWIEFRDDLVGLMEQIKEAADKLYRMEQQWAKFMGK